MNLLEGQSSMPYLSGITIYPVKSLDGLRLAEATVLPCGAILNDRRWRLIDTEGRVVNAKRTDRFHSIRAQFEGMDDDSTRLSQSASGHFVTLWIGHELDEMSGNSQSVETFPLIPGSEGPCEWLSDALREHVFLEERVEGGFPDDRDAAGPTVISTETLSEVARWFGWDDAEAKRRFRMNLELTAESEEVSSDERQNSELAYEAFWEDRLAFPGKRNSKASGEAIIHLTIFLWVSPMIFHWWNYFDPPVPVDVAEQRYSDRRQTTISGRLKPVDIVGSDRTLTQEIGRTITGLV